ncbi:hypothetical protein Y032_0297g1740 [Ancylostoma ceylanicum]|uniref:Ionotropic glutamate receptor C-terminal domain-containing protein n=2 Tax=Ancylostoma ceylanicum TaxID=53326 RepID=A0A016S4W0_9BILA|nr:hypothetical protein Y032_0297g1740 [Ancylostoma ceylanicum]
MKMVADSLHLAIDAVVVNNAVGSLDWGTLQIQPVYVVKRQKTTIGSVLWNAFKPYSYITWLAILASFVVQLLVMVFISYAEVKMKRRPRFRPYEMAWEVLQLQLDEKSENMVFHTIAGNTILFIFSLLQSAFFTYLYEGLLLSALIQQGEENPFKDADGLIRLIAEGKYHLVTNYRGNWYFDELDHSNSSHFAKLRAATSSNPVVVAKSVSDALDMVDKGNYIFPIQQDSLAMQMSKERCNFVYVNKGLPQRSAHLIFANNSLFLNAFNTGIIMQASFIQRTFHKYFLAGSKIGKIPKCPATEFVEGSKSLDANSVIGIFTLGAIGMSFALVAFVAEIYHFWHKNVFMRKWRANAPLGGVENILAVANIHLNSSNEDRFDLLKLAEYRERIQERRHSRETYTSL